MKANADREAMEVTYEFRGKNEAPALCDVLGLGEDSLCFFGLDKTKVETPIQGVGHRVGVEFDGLVRRSKDPVGYLADVAYGHLCIRSLSESLNGLNSFLI